MRRFVLKFLPLLLLPLIFWACSSEGVSCSGAICGSGEVCDGGKCVLGLSFDEPEEAQACERDEDCPAEKVCSLTTSKPRSTCIPQLDCDLDGDCHSGLSCAGDGVCR